MLAAGFMNAGYGDIGPYGAVATKNHAGVGYAIATQSTPFSKDGPKLAQATWNSFPVMTKVHFSPVITEVAEFGSSTEVDVFSEDGVANVVEMWRFGPGEENRVLHFRCMANHGVGTNPREFTDVGPAAHDGPWTDVARPNQVRSSFNGGRRVDDDTFASGEKTRVFNADVAAQDLHLGFQSRLMVGVEHPPHRFILWKGGEVATFCPGKRGKESRGIGELTPVHAPSKWHLGMNVVMAQDARW